jgi:magnesium chelatase family protein
MLAERGGGETTSAIAARVLVARSRMAARYTGSPWRTNADVPATVLAERWPLRGDALTLLGKAMDQGALTARGFGRVHRLAWTAADLDGSAWPDRGHVGRALSLRLGDLQRGSAAA